MRKALFATAGAVLLVVAGLIAFALYRKQQSHDVRGSSTQEFVTTQQEEPKPVNPGGKIRWPMYRFDAARLGTAERMLVEPPYKPLWFFRAHSLVEFPPAVAYGRLYFANAVGVLFAVDTTKVKARWTYNAHRCTAASPAVDGHSVYMSFLNAPPCNATRGGLDGQVVAFNADTGKVRWRLKIGPTESSPLVANGRVYVGDWRGNVYSLDAETGKIQWTFRTSGRVKGAAALSGNRLFIGSYDSHVYALGARTGKLIWRASAQQRLGHRGQFYATPAIAYGRVYVGATDGKVYSFGAASGKLRWSHGTGGYVYGSPAIWRKRVYVGSYSKTFFCFDAATGDVVWKFKANGPISGSATIVDGVVYFATLKRRTYGLDARTGKQLWIFPDGKYSPVVADKKRLYVVGYARMYGMVPR